MRLALLLLTACGRIDFDLRAGPDAPPDAPPVVPNVIHKSTNGTNGTASTTTGLVPTQSGALLVVATGSFNASYPVAAITDDVGDTFVSANARATTGVGPGDQIEIYYAANSRGGATAVTIDSAGVTTREVWILEVLDMDPLDPVDNVATQSDGPVGMVVSAPQVTTTTPTSLIVSAAEVANTITGLDPSSPFLGVTISNGNGTAYYVATARGTYGAVWDLTSPGSYCATTVAFRPRQ